MVLRLLTLPFRLFGLVFSVVFTTAFVEGFGLFMYLQWQHPGAADRLLSGGVTPAELGAFFSAYPDLLPVAGGLALVGVLLGLSDSSGSSVGFDGDDDFDGGFDGGFGGDGGGGGGE